MTTEDLDRICEIANSRRVVALIVKMGGDEVHATFEPDPGPVNEPPAGSWKDSVMPWSGPVNLDAPQPAETPVPRSED